MVTWLRQCLSFSPQKSYSFPLFPCCSHWKEVTMYNPYIRSGELCSTYLDAEYLHKLFVIWTTLVIFYWIIYSSMDSWVFIRSFIIRFYFIYLVATIGFFGHWESFQFTPMSPWCTHIIVFLFIFVFVFSASLLSGTTRWSRFICIFPALFLKSKKFPLRSPDYLFWWVVLYNSRAEC